MYRVLVTGLLPRENGIATSAMNLYRNMDRDLIQWDFVLYSEYKGKLSAKDTHEEEIRDLGGKIYYLNYNPKEIPKGSRKKFREIMEGDKDLMGVHTQDHGVNTYPLYIAKQMDMPIRIMHYHAGCAKSQVNEYLNNIPHQRKIRLKMIEGDDFERWCCSDLSGVEAYRGMQYDIFPNAVDTQKFSYNPLYAKLIRSQLKIPDDAVVVGFVGTVYDVKNPLFALEAFRKYLYINRNAYMLMIGRGDKVLECKDFVEKHRMKKKVFLLGSQTQIDMFYSAIDILLCPSQKEGFPNILAEAQSAGVQCLVSDEVTDMVKLTPLVQMYSLKEGEKAWAEKINEMEKIRGKRRSYSKEVKRPAMI